MILHKVLHLLQQNIDFEQKTHPFWIKINTQYRHRTVYNTGRKSGHETQKFNPLNSLRIYHVRCVQVATILWWYPVKHVSSEDWGCW